MAHSVCSPSRCSPAAAVLPHAALDRSPYPSLSSRFSAAFCPFRPLSAQQSRCNCFGETLHFSSGHAIHKNSHFLERSLSNREPWRRKASTSSFYQQNSSSSSAGSGDYGAGGDDGRGGSGGGDNRDGDGGDDQEDDAHSTSGEHWRFGLLPSFADGWRERVRADPQFPFKILTEEIIGVAASVFGDMSCRPGFGLAELDFVFSNLIVCAIVNFALMYVLAPTPLAAAGGCSLPGLFSSCPKGHMWEAGAYSLSQRVGTFVYKGALFAVVGFGAGLVGTALSTMLLNVRRKLDPGFTLQNTPPPTFLNASTWALQLGVSSNTRYQLLNGLEFGLEGVMNPSVFKGLVFAIRSLNNVVGGMSFMMMARLTGSQERPKQMLEMQS